MKSKILFFQPTLNSNGGIDRVTKTLSSRLEEVYECLFLTAYAPDASFSTSATFSLNENETDDAFSKIGKITSRARAVAVFYTKNAIDTVIVSADGCIISALLAKMFLCKSMRVVAYMHQEIEKSALPHRVALRLLLPYADSVVGVSRGITKKLEAVVDRTKLHCIYNATDIISNQKRSLLPLENPEDEKHFTPTEATLVSVGRLAYEKAQWRLIETMAEVVKDAPGATLLIIGEGPMREFLQKRISELGMEKNIFLLGIRANVFPYIAQARALILSSFSESFGLVLVEALSIGVPVVSSDCNFGPREILLDSLDTVEKYPIITPYGVMIGLPSAGMEPIQAADDFVAAIQILLDSDTSFNPQVLKERAMLFDVGEVIASWKTLLNGVTTVKTIKSVVFVGMNDLLVPFVNFFAEKGSKVHIFNGHHSSRIAKNVSQQHKNYGFFGISRILRLFDLQLSLPFYFQDLQPDLIQEAPQTIVVMDFIRFWFWQVVAYKKKHPEIKLFLYAETKRTPRNLLSKFLFPVFLFFLQKNAHVLEKIFVYTKEGKSFLEKHVSGVEIMYMPVGVDETLFHVIDRTYLPEGTLRLLMNARFVAFKNHADVLRSIACLSEEEKKKIKISFVGSEGSESKRIHALVKKLHLEEVVAFLPTVQHEHINVYYWQHDVLILPSYNEAIGMVVPEAMACGLATITSDTVGANSYVVEGKTGLVFKTGDRKALADILRRYVNGMNIQEIGTAAAREIAGGYTDSIRNTVFFRAIEENSIQ